MSFWDYVFATVELEYYLKHLSIRLLRIESIENHLVDDEKFNGGKKQEQHIISEIFMPIYN